MHHRSTDFQGLDNPIRSRGMASKRVDEHTLPHREVGVHHSKIGSRSSATGQTTNSSLALARRLPPAADKPPPEPYSAMCQGRHLSCSKTALIETENA